MSMAVKHAMNKKKTKGVHESVKPEKYGEGTSAARLASPGIAKEMHREKLSELESMRSKDRTNLAEGGDVPRYRDDDHENVPQNRHRYPADAKESREHSSYGTHRSLTKNKGQSFAGEFVRKGDHSNAKLVHEGVRDEMRSMRGHDRKNLAEGGDVDCMACQGGTCMEHGGLVDRIMKKRGAVEEAPNDFDELDLEPAPEADYPGSNEHGDAQVEEDDRDLVARIMRSRAKKDRMPRTA